MKHNFLTALPLQRLFTIFQSFTLTLSNFESHSLFSCSLMLIFFLCFCSHVCAGSHIFRDIHSLRIFFIAILLYIFRDSKNVVQLLSFVTLFGAQKFVEWKFSTKFVHILILSLKFLFYNEGFSSAKKFFKR